MTASNLKMRSASNTSVSSCHHCSCRTLIGSGCSLGLYDRPSGTALFGPIVSTFFCTFEGGGDPFPEEGESVQRPPRLFQATSFLLLNIRRAPLVERPIPLLFAPLASSAPGVSIFHGCCRHGVRAEAVRNAPRKSFIFRSPRDS